MRDAWAQIADGVSLIAGAVAALCRGPEGIALASTPPASAPDSTPAATPDAGSGSTHDPLRALIDALIAKTVAGMAPPGAAEAVAEAVFEEEFDEAQEPIHPAPAPLVAQPCMELARQAREKGRRAALEADALNALEVGAYYSKYLRTQPQKAEEWVRCLEAIPGSAPERLQQAFAQGGIPAWQTYAALWEEIRHDIEEAKKTATAFQVAHPDQAGEWLDADREGRLWFWLGDKPAESDLVATTFNAAPIEAREILPDSGAPLRIIPLHPDAALAGAEMAALAGMPGGGTP